ncbi:MAG: Ig-like domain-containing protein [Bacilli bacterium]|jgi:uncharacterized protein YjdB|nr:Ig-like domain-containing protein [Bacilli bacterium]
MHKSKKLFTILSSAALALTVGGVAIGVGSGKVRAADAEGTATIGSLSDFNSVFDGGAGSSAKDITLTADIDLGGMSFGMAKMAGEYTGTFDGGGHKITNFLVGANAGLFNISSGTIKNLTLECTANANGTSPLAFQNNGSITGCHVVETVSSALNTLSCYFCNGTGTISDSYAHYIFNASCQGTNSVFPFYREGSQTITDSYYTKNDATTGIAIAANAGASETEQVCGVSIADKIITMGTDGTLSASTYGSTYSAIAWTIDDAGVATLSNETTDTVTISGVAAGTATLTCTYTSTLGSFASSSTITVQNSTAVSDVSVSPTSTSIYEGATTPLTAALTGNVYDHVAWTSDDESHATVAGDGLTATVTGVAAGSANVTITVYDSSNGVLASASCAVTVNAAVTFDLYLAVNSSFSWTAETAIFYGGGIAETSLAMTNTGYTLRLNDATNSNTLTEYDLYHLSVNASALGMVGKTGVYMQASNGQNAGRWGSGYNVDSYVNGFALYTPFPASGALQSICTGNGAKEGIAWATGLTDWRDANDSICYLLDDENEAKKTAILDSYNALSSNAKTFLGTFTDDTADYDSTYGTTISYLSAGGNPAIAVFSELPDTKYTILFVTIGVAALAVGGYFIVRAARKRKGKN